jgi:hypothetical protein
MDAISPLEAHGVTTQKTVLLAVHRENLKFNFTKLEDGRSRVRFAIRSLDFIFSIYLILQEPG